MLKDIGLIIMRFTVGGLFVTAGIVKLTLPTQEFILAIEQYQLLPELFIPPFATILPFIEVIFGTFLILGLFQKTASLIIGLQLVAFIIAISWALAHGIDLTDCGCFGGKVPFLDVPPVELLIRDIILLIFCGITFFFSPSKWSIDELIGKI